MITKTQCQALKWTGTAKQLKTILNLQYWRFKMDKLQKKKDMTLLEYIQEIY